MKKFMRMLGIFALVTVISLSACKDDPAPETCQNGKFEATVNGDLVVGSSFDNMLLKGREKQMSIRATDANGRVLLISFKDQSRGADDGISTDEYISHDDAVTGIENTFMFVIIEGGLFHSFAGGSLDITSCDADKKKVSGTFSFADADFEVTNGTFTDMCYRVIQ